MSITGGSKKMSESKERIVQRIEELAILLNGSASRFTSCNSTGRQSKKIVIEYDVTNTNNCD